MLTPFHDLTKYKSKSISIHESFVLEIVFPEKVIKNDHLDMGML